MIYFFIDKCGAVVAFKDNEFSFSSAKEGYEFIREHLPQGRVSISFNGEVLEVDKIENL